MAFFAQNCELQAEKSIFKLSASFVAPPGMLREFGHKIGEKLTSKR